MALFKILRGNSTNISTSITPYHDGWAYFTVDDGKFYIDANDQRIQINPKTTLTDLGITATNTELNKLDGVTVSTNEINMLGGVSSNIQTQLNEKAPLESPNLIGTPIAPTAVEGTNTTQIATTEFVSTAIANAKDVVTVTSGTKEYASLTLNTDKPLELGDLVIIPKSVFVIANTYPDYIFVEQSDGPYQADLRYTNGDYVNLELFDFSTLPEHLLCFYDWYGEDGGVSRILWMLNYSESVDLADIGAVNKAGDTMTGYLVMKDLRLTDGTTTRTVAQIFDDDDGTTNYGSELVVGAAGNTFIGSGESATNLRTALQSAVGTNEVYGATAEHTYISADGQIMLSANCNTIASRKTVRITTAGAVVVPNNTDYTTAKARNIKASTTDLTAGTSALSNGDIYLVYE